MSSPAARERVFSGIQPSGASHLGNYLGAQRNYVALQDEYEAIYAIVDYHALTTVHDGEELRRLTREMALDLLAVGLDPDRCALIRQSDFPEVAELCWIFSTVVPVSWLERNPTYKEGLAEGKDNSNGLLTYPVLQAADIVIYKASRVPVGKDQAPHLELSREIVRAFNHRYGPIFPEPNAVFTDAPVVLGTDGARKMSKSAWPRRGWIGQTPPRCLPRRQAMPLCAEFGTNPRPWRCRLKRDAERRGSWTMINGGAASRCSSAMGCPSTCRRPGGIWTRPRIWPATFRARRSSSIIRLSFGPQRRGSGRMAPEHGSAGPASQRGPEDHLRPRAT